jgi:putative flippase GtrA
MRQTVSALWSPRNITQFVSVGVVGAIVETIIVAILTTKLGTAPLTAKAVGAECSITVMFLLNDHITFAGKGLIGMENVARRWVRSHVVRIGGLAIAFAVLWILTTQTDIQLIVFGADMWPTVANMIGICTGMVLNYIGECIFTWDILNSNRSRGTNR